MNYKLINKPNDNFTPIEQICYNRGVKNIDEYTHLNSQNINTPFDFPLELMERGAAAIARAFKNNQRILLVIDSDCDGFCSSALIYNYLSKAFPSYIDLIEYVLHDGKQHGLEEWRNIINLYSLVICPDAGTNDIEIFKDFKNTTFLILDHHLQESNEEYPNTIIINNQTCNYPNKELSGTGVTWQFCRYLDTKLDTFYADEMLDLVALSQVSDMMSLLSFETRYLLNIGFQFSNINNTFIEYMLDKNEYSITKPEYISSKGNACTPIAAAFYIVPFVNAMTRSGTQEEKDLLFKSMLNNYAHTLIASTKRGHKGEQEELAIQAIRTAINVKNRQTKEEQKGMEYLEKLIKEYDMLSHKALIFLLDNEAIPSTIRGLVANKLMAKYQRPCCVLSKTGNNTYAGSARGYTKTGIKDFKYYCSLYPNIIMTAGHENAFGLEISADKANSFINFLDEQLKNYSSELLYYIDYYLTGEQSDYNTILSIGMMNDLWGQDFERSYVLVRFKITSSNFNVMKGNTLKINLPNEVSVIKFSGTEDEIKLFSTKGYVEIEAICKCVLNNWQGETTPQLIIEDYNVIRKSNFYF